MKSLNRILLTIFLATAFFFGFSGSAQAQVQTICPAGQVDLNGYCVDPDTGNISVGSSGQAVPQAVKELEQGVAAAQNNLLNLEDHNYDTGRDFFAMLLTFLVGNKKIDQVKSEQGVLTSVSNSIVALYNPPATTQMFVADLMQDVGLNIAKPAYAQGLGFSALNPVLDAWKTFRNIAYFFYVVLFMIVGFMIMFRQKIGSQTVVSVQQALPNIVISLLAVTFSYAIAGLLIDAMYLIMFLMIALFAPQVSDKLMLDGQQLNLTSINIVQLGRLLITPDNVKTVAESISELVGNTLGGPSGGISVPGALGWVTGIAGSLIFAVALVFSLFRLFFELLKTYVEIIISIILAPIALMLGALPGSKAFSDWLKYMAYSLMVFPATLIVIMLAFLVSKNVGSATGGGGFIPPYLGGYGNGNAIAALVGMGMLLLLPDFISEIKKQAPKGVFSQFAGHLSSAVKKGWTGGELIPGVGLTNTSKWPAGGFTGENLSKKLGITSYATLGGGLAVARDPRNFVQAARAGIASAGGEAALALGDKTIYKDAQQRIEAQRKANQAKH